MDETYEVTQRGAPQIRVVKISNETLPVKWRGFAADFRIVLHVMVLYEHANALAGLGPLERSAWIAATIRGKLPSVSVLSWGVGEECELVMHQLSDRPPYAVGAMREPSEQLDSIEEVLMLRGKSDPPRRLDTTRFAVTADALIFCAMLWHERPQGFRPGVSEMPCQGGSDMGIAAECAMLALADLAVLGKFDLCRGQEDFIHVLVPAYHHWSADRELLERSGHRYPY